LLFTDINMPGSMDGLKLASVVSDRWPAIEILIASARVPLRKSDLPPNSRFLRKPYRSAAMIAERSSPDAGVTSGKKIQAMSCFAHTCRRYQA